MWLWLSLLRRVSSTTTLPVAPAPRTKVLTWSSFFETMPGMLETRTKSLKNECKNNTVTVESIQGNTNSVNLGSGPPKAETKEDTTKAAISNIKDATIILIASIIEN